MQYSAEDFERYWYSLKYRRLIKERYTKKKVVVSVDEDQTEEMGIERGVRQGYCLSPTIFNIYAEKPTEKALEKARSMSVVGERKL